MEHTGSCFCGEIEYRVEIEGARIDICHCRDCQIFSGSAFRTSCMVPSSSFHFVRGTPNTFDKTAESGQVRRMAFCGTCGTHLCSMSPLGAQDGYVSVRISTSRQFDQLRPAGELFCSSRVAWLPPLEGMRQFPGMPTGRDLENVDER